MRLVGYIRVSRVKGREGDRFISPDVQRERVDALALAGGHTVVEWIEDLDESGGTMRRPGMERAMRMVETGEAQGVAVARLDRFSRSAVDVELGVRRLEQAGGIFLAADLGMDTSTAGGKLMRTVLAAVAEFQLDRFRETWREATERAVARGTRGGVPPIGYRRRQDGRFEPDEQAARVRDLFEQRAAGMSWVQLAQRFGSSSSKVRRIIRSRTYLGEIRVGDAVTEAAHEPLVTRAVWEAAQSPPGVSRARRGSHLAGVLRCAGCGHAMTFETGGARRYPGYRCVRFHARGRCPAPAKIGAVRAERHVTGLVLDRLHGLRFEPVARTGRTDEAERALDEAELELAVYRDSEAVSVIGPDVFVAGLRSRQGRVDAAREALVDARGREALATIGSRDLDRAWGELDMLGRRAVIGAVVVRVECARAHRSGPGIPVGDRLRVVWVDDGPAGLVDAG